MKTRTKQIITPRINPLVQDKLSEIAEILLNGICRLEAKENGQNHYNSVDKKDVPRVHAASSIPN